MSFITTRRAACFSMLTLTVALAQAATIGVINTPTPTRVPAPTQAPATTTVEMGMHVPKLLPPDLAMISLTPSKTTVNRMEAFKLTYTIKNVGTKAVANASIGLTASYYPLSAGADVGALAVGETKTGTIDVTVMKDSMMNMSPEPYPVHIHFTAKAKVVGAVGPDLNPANDEVTSVTVTANPG